MSHKNKKTIMILMLLAALSGSKAFAQEDLKALDQRVGNLEDYVATFQSTMTAFSDNLNKSIEQYTKGLETSLENYSQKLQVSLDERLNRVNRNMVVMDPYSKDFQSIETNSGTFLISIERTETLVDGLRLTLNIGNPNYADYRNFKLKFVWGSRWAGEADTPYNEWRNSLFGAEYSFQGMIEKGKWNTVNVDLHPVTEQSLNYLECEMYVESVELGYE